MLAPPKAWPGRKARAFAFALVAGLAPGITDVTWSPRQSTHPLTPSRRKEDWLFILTNSNLSSLKQVLPRIGGVRGGDCGAEPSRWTTSAGNAANCSGWSLTLRHVRLAQCRRGRMMFEIVGWDSELSRWTTSAVTGVRGGVRVARLRLSAISPSPEPSPAGRGS